MGAARTWLWFGCAGAWACDSTPARVRDAERDCDGVPGRVDGAEKVACAVEARVKASSYSRSRASWLRRLVEN